MSSLKLITKYNSEIINQQILFEIDGIESKLIEQIILLQDKHIKKALIDLGWTPPENENKS
jgi:hypothetical protein